MKKVILTIIVVVGFIVAGISIYKGYENKHYYDNVKINLHRKMIKETIVDYTDSVRNDGVKKRIYREYDYCYSDSIEHTIHIDREHYIECYLNEYGDTLYLEYIDTSNYPRREE